MGFREWWSERQLERLFEDAGKVLAQGVDGVDRAAYVRYADDPVGFVREILGAEPWTKQEQIARALLDHDRVTVRSCHAAGKDWLAARLALWWTYARRGLVILTGPTSVQVEETLMRDEIAEAFRGSGLPGELHVRALRPWGESRAGILARTSRDVSRLTGFHDARVLVIITEAQDPEVEVAWDAAFACATGAYDRILTLGNPVEDSNARFRRAHRPGSGWEIIRIGAEDIPNVREDREVIPGLLSRRAIRAFEVEYGADSRAVTARVHAEFPEAPGTDRAFPAAWLQAAVRRHEEGTLEGIARDDAPWIGGLDPAGGGPNESVLALRQGPVLRELVVLEGRDEALLDDLSRTLRERDLWDRLELLVVDAMGPGTYLPGWLEERGLRATKYKGGAGASDPEEFVNARTEAFWRLREDLRRGWVALPDDERLLEELGAIRWGVDSNGRIKLEAKKELKSRLGRSPDRADACALAFLPQVTAGGGRTTEEVLADEVAGNFLEEMMGRDPRQIVDDDLAGGWSPVGRPLPY